MELQADYLKKFARKKVSENQALADEIFTYFGKRLAFSRIMRIIKEKGKIFVRETFEQTKKDDCQNELSLFLWKCKEAKVNWKKA